MPIDKGILEWIGRNKTLAGYLILIAGNAYQFIYHKEYESKMNTFIQDTYVKSVEYERKRSEKLEKLLVKFQEKTSKEENETE